MLYYDKYQSEIGDIHIIASETVLERIILFEEEWEQYPKSLLKKEGNAITKSFKEQLEAYFNGQRKYFDIAYELKGTPFQIQVWEVLKSIPYGETRSYKEVAETIGNIKAVRAIGQANKANKFPILIPCHRVIGKSGKLVGYGGAYIDKQGILLEGEKNKERGR